VLNAFVWGVIAAFSLVIGGLIASWMTIRQRALGLIMAFGAGVLISAVALKCPNPFGKSLSTSEGV
jgi:ZIP family zinc transporter